jgi:hypothetical protein
MRRKPLQEMHKLLYTHQVHESIQTTLMNMDEATAVPYAARHADNFQMV